MANDIEASRASVYGDIQPDDVRIRDPFTLEIFKGHQTRGRFALEALRERAATVYYKGFGIGIMQTAEEVGESLIRGGSAFFVRIDKQDIAISIQYPMRVAIPIDDRGSERWAKALYTASRLVLPEYQEQDIATWTMEVQDEEYRPDYFVGRTQNPVIHLAWKSMPFTGEDRPIDKDYTGEDLKSRQFRAILEVVAKRTTNRLVHPDSGLAKYVYKEGETKGFTPNLSNERYVEIDNRMKALGLVRSHGDTLYYTIERVEPTQNNPA